MDTGSKDDFQRILDGPKMTEVDPNYIYIPRTEYESLKTIAYGMRAAVRYQRVGRIVDFQRAMQEVMSLINQEDKES